MNPEESPTTVLLRRWHAGDEDAVRELLERHLPWIRAHVQRRLGPALRRAGETGDYVQEALLEFLRYGPRFVVSEDHRLRGLLARIVENVLRDEHDRYAARRRARARERPLPSDSVLDLDAACDPVTRPSEVAERREWEAWVRLALELLDPEDREV